MYAYLTYLFYREVQVVSDQSLPTVQAYKITQSIHFIYMYIAL